MSKEADNFNSFDKADALVDVPESSRKKKLVKLGAKVLETRKEARKVLPEEQYVQNLEKLIVRDYFPELPKMKAQAEYLEAVANNDHLKIRELQIRYSTQRATDRRTSPSQRPRSPTAAGGAGAFDPETPGPAERAGGEDGKMGGVKEEGTEREGTTTPYANTEGDNEAFLEQKKRKKCSKLDELTVQTYLEKYTSEDNASFEELAELGKKRERVKNAWMYEAERKHNESLVFRGTQMIEEADEQMVAMRNETAQRPVDVDNWTYKARNVVLFNHLAEAPLTMGEHIERAKQREMAINREATRFGTEAMTAQRPQQQMMARVTLQNIAKNAGHIDITGKLIGIEAKTVGLVATPTPAPGIDDSPLMTWGEIEGTPFRLDAPDIQPSLEDAPAFRIPEVPIREKIAQGIAEQIASRYHNKRKRAMDQIQQMAPKTPKFNSVRSSGGRLATMSPAARSLLGDKLGIRLGTDRIKVSPSPRGSASRTVFSPAIYQMIKVKNEPKSGATTPKRAAATPTSSSSSVTDDLLRIPSPGPSTLIKNKEQREAQQRKVSETEETQQNMGKRPSAADFF
ncbi:hypothetical protein niasHS_003932 [Heterodera schachtii]|uniref:Uncharacterized protein n=1 Tax=Heterodera schachtii TaxID=97005 RepID=A0ABD2K3M4_HETSC